MQYTITYLSQKTREILDVEQIEFPSYDDAQERAVKECLRRGDDYIFFVRPKNG